MPTHDAGTSAASVGKAVILLTVAGVVVYVAIEWLFPLIAAIGGIGSTIGDVVTTVGGGVVQAGKTLLGLPDAVWRVFAGSTAKWAPNPKLTPELIASANGKMTFLDIAQVVATWAYAAVYAKNGETQDDGAMEQWLRDNSAAVCYPALQRALMSIFKWSSPAAGVHDGSPLDMKKAGSPFWTDDGGDPLDKLYRLSATLIAAGPSQYRDSVHVTAGYLTWVLWYHVFPVGTTTVTGPPADRTSPTHGPVGTPAPSHL